MEISRAKSENWKSRVVIKSEKREVKVKKNWYLNPTSISISKSPRKGNFLKLPLAKATSEIPDLKSYGYFNNFSSDKSRTNSLNSRGAVTENIRIHSWLSESPSRIFVQHKMHKDLWTIIKDCTGPRKWQATQTKRFRMSRRHEMRDKPMLIINFNGVLAKILWVLQRDCLGAIIDTLITCAKLEVFTERSQMKKLSLDRGHSRILNFSWAPSNSYYLLIDTERNKTHWLKLLIIE